MDKAYEFLSRKIGLKYGDAVVVGVSGGPDSMALLHMLVELKKEADIVVICAHVNHNVRKESIEERSFIKKYCDNLGIIFETMTIESYGDDNFHNEARTKRYTFFNEIIAKYNAKFLLTAHHADDLIETIMMRIVRGSTLKGYSGFGKVIKMKNYQIIRPLIEYTKEEILDYCKKNNLKFVQDASNQKDIYTRNRYRKYLLPFLKKEDPKVHEKFIKFSQTLLEYNNFVDKIASSAIKEVYQQQILDIEKLKEKEKIIQTKIINYILEGIYQDDLMLIYDNHMELIMNLINSNKPNSYIYLPNNIKVIKSYNNLTFAKEVEYPQEYEIELLNYVNLPNGKNLSIVTSSDQNDNFICRLSSNEITLPLYIHNRKEGEKIEVKGMLGSKKIKDIFIDEKISLEERATWPVVIDSSGKVVWLPGLKKSKYDKAKNESYDIIIRYY